MSKEYGSDSMRMWGFLLRSFRLAVGMTHDELAAIVGYSKSLVVGIERGTRMPSALFVQKADDGVKANGWLVEAARHLSRQRFLSWYEEYADAERRSRSLWTYDTHVLHGLLRTEAYARAVLAVRRPVLTEEEIEERLQVVLRRQELLTRQPACALSFIIDEWVLRRSVGGQAAMREQVEHLLHLSELRNVTVQIMPTSQDAHPGLDGPMTVLETPEHTWIAHLSVQGTSRLIDEPDEVSVLHERYTALRSHALTPKDSTALLERLAGGLPPA